MMIMFSTMFKHDDHVSAYILFIIKNDNFIQNSIFIVDI